MNEKRKAILIVSLIIVILSGSYILLGIQLHNRTIDQIIEQEKAELDALINSQQYYSLEPYRRRVENLLATSPAIIRAFADRDRQGLFAMVRPKYESLRRENDYFREMNFYLPDGTGFLRLQPSDDANDQEQPAGSMILAAILTGRQQGGYETCAHGASYRIAQPVFAEERLLGVLEFAIDACGLTSALARKIGDEVVVYLLADALKREIPFPVGSTVRSGNFILLDAGLLFAGFPEDFDYSRDGAEISVADRSYIVHSHQEFFDFEKRAIGGVIALQDITLELDQKNLFVAQSLLMSSILFAFSIAVLYVTFGSLIGKLARSGHSLQKMNEDLRREIEAHDQVKRKLQSTQRQWEKTFDAVSDIITLQNTAMEIQHINRAGCRHFRMTPAEVQGKLCYELFRGTDSPCQGCPIPFARERFAPFTAEIEHPNLKRIFLVSATPIVDERGELEAVVHFCKDISDLKKMENQLYQAQKMESIGRLAGGVAHDFNNILSVIQGYADLSLRKMGENESYQLEMKNISQASRKGARLTQQLLAFSRKQVISPEHLDLNKEIRETWKMLNRLLGEHIDSEFKPAAELWPVLGDRSQMEQMIINLAVNARDAMPYGGKLTIATDNTTIGPGMSRDGIHMKPGNYVQLAVTDTGQGMSREVREHIFEPFFTTKGQTNGTGLGLATVYGVVNQNNGYIFVESEPDQGTSFTILLPCAIGTPSRSYGEIVEIPREKMAGTATVLIVEDDPMVRELGKEILECEGYSVLAAENGESAMDLFATGEISIDLLLTDMVLPAMNGMELARQVKEVRHDIKILYMSGYTADYIINQKGLRIGENFVYKPISPEILLPAVASLLAERETKRKQQPEQGAALHG